MFELKIETKEKLGLTPPLIGYLGSISEYSYSYRFYGIRHPGGIFNSQLMDVTSNMLDLVKYVNELKIPVENKSWDNKELIRKFTVTLFSFNNYFNSAYDIILGCCKKEQDIPSGYIWRWLKEKGYIAGSNYYSNLSELRFFLDLFNEIKHSSNRFGTVMLKRLEDDVQIIGYYLESVDSSGALVPKAKFHPQYNDKHTAISFNFDLRKLYYGIYKIADSLLTVLLDHFKEVWGIKLVFNKERTENDHFLRELFQNVNQIPLKFLPNEIKSNVPIPRIVKENQNQYLIFKDHQIKNNNGSYQISTNLTPGDGFSRSWGLPYFKE